MAIKNLFSPLVVDEGHPEEVHEIGGHDVDCLRAILHARIHNTNGGRRCLKQCAGVCDNLVKGCIEKSLN